jgi:predicted dehydrogenase
MTSTRSKTSPIVTRRQALKAGAAALAAGPALRTRRASAHLLGQKLRIAAVGVGNKGWDDVKSIASAPGAKIVALCDVDSNFLDHAAEEFNDARRFADYRQMLDEAADQIDAVIVSTPDHMHGAISLAAMSAGKHVYVQKPLAHNLAELRRMVEAADEKRLVTQMGTQIHSHESYRTAAALLRQGVLGRVREAHSWVSSRLPLPMKKRPDRADQVPPTLNWDLWQGVAPEHAYVDGLYHPFNWRMWRDYGCGTLGDMGCHLFDPIFSGLGLRPPVAVRSGGPAHLPDTYSPDADVTFTFAGTPLTADEFTIRWTNGAVRPHEALAQLPKQVNGKPVTLPGGGSFIVGEKGVMVLPHWSMPQLYAGGAVMDVPVESVGSVDHYHEWVAACRGEGRTSTPLSYGGMVTEAVLTGVVAGHFPEHPLRWNSAELEFDEPRASALVHREYRDGWRPPGL